MFIANAQLLKQQAGLNVSVVLVLAALIFGDITFNCMIENLTHLHARIDSYRLNGKHFQRPEPAETNVAKARRNMNKQTEATDGGSAFQHGHVIVRFGVLDCPAKVELIWLQDHTVFRNGDTAKSIGPFHVQHDFFVDQKLVVEREVVAVGIQLFLMEGLNIEVLAKLGFDFAAAENHESFAERNERGII